MTRTRIKIRYYKSSASDASTEFTHSTNLLKCHSVIKLVNIKWVTQGQNTHSTIARTGLWL